MIYAAIVFLPALGALIVGFFGRFLGVRASELITTSLLIVSCILSWIVFWRMGFEHETDSITVLRWITSGELDVSWAFKVDTLTAVMFVVVTTVSALVHVYSIGYMSEDPSRPRFFSYLSGFTFSMLMLVTSDNLLQLFFGWEGVGLFSYLLIGFWYQKESANAAAIKAFIVNRVGDFGFALGIFGLFAIFRTINIDALFAAGSELGLKPFGIRAMDSMRLEKSYRMVGTELSIEYSAYESAMDRFVKPDKGNFVGRDALLAWHTAGNNYLLVTLVVSDVDDADALGNNALFKDGEIIGRATGGGFGFRIDRSLALRMVRPELADLGTELEIEILGKNYPATVVADSPFDPKNERLRDVNGANG